jgi:hypothetical protein
MPVRDLVMTSIGKYALVPSAQANGLGALGYTPPLLWRIRRAEPFFPSPHPIRQRVRISFRAEQTMLQSFACEILRNAPCIFRTIPKNTSASTVSKENRRSMRRNFSSARASLRAAT